MQIPDLGIIEDAEHTQRQFQEGLATVRKMKAESIGPEHDDPYEQYKHDRQLYLDRLMLNRTATLERIDYDQRPTHPDREVVVQGWAGTSDIAGARFIAIAQMQRRGTDKADITLFNGSFSQPLVTYTLRRRNG